MMPASHKDTVDLDAIAWDPKCQLLGPVDGGCAQVCRQFQTGAGGGYVCQKAKASDLAQRRLTWVLQPIDNRETRHTDVL